MKGGVQNSPTFPSFQDFYNRKAKKTTTNKLTYSGACAPARCMQTPGTNHKRRERRNSAESWERAWKLPSASPSLHSRGPCCNRCLKTPDAWQRRGRRLRYYHARLSRTPKKHCSRWVYQSLGKSRFSATPLEWRVESTPSPRNTISGEKNTSGLLSTSLINLLLLLTQSSLSSTSLDELNEIPGPTSYVLITSSSSSRYWHLPDQHK